MDVPNNNQVGKKLRNRPQADMAAVCTKINALRVFYRRQLMKVKDNKTSGKEMENVKYLIDGISTSLIFFYVA